MTAFALLAVDTSSCPVLIAFNVNVNVWRDARSQLSSKPFCLRSDRPATQMLADTTGCSLSLDERFATRAVFAESLGQCDQLVRHLQLGTTFRTGMRIFGSPVFAWAWSSFSWIFIESSFLAVTTMVVIVKKRMINTRPSRWTSSKIEAYDTVGSKNSTLLRSVNNTYLYK